MMPSETVEEALVRKVHVKVFHQRFKYELQKHQITTRNTKTCHFQMIGFSKGTVSTVSTACITVTGENQS
jgi:hypothetical protein